MAHHSLPSLPNCCFLMWVSRWVSLGWRCMCQPAPLPSPCPSLPILLPQPSIFKSVGKLLKVLLLVYVPMWVVIAPIAMALWFLLLPYTLVRRLLVGPGDTSPMQVQSYPAAAHGAHTGQTLFFIHGWPDCGRLWHKQVRWLCVGVRALRKMGSTFTTGGQGGGRLEA